LPKAEEARSMLKKRKIWQNNKNKILRQKNQKQAHEHKQIPVVSKKDFAVVPKIEK
jgi:hypothetical protein